MQNGDRLACCAWWSWEASSAHVGVRVSRFRDAACEPYIGALPKVPLRCKVGAMRKVVALGCGLVLVALAVRPVVSQTDDRDVLTVIPENYTLLLENAFVRVIEARVPPGAEEKPHRHMRGVSICMTEYTVERAPCRTASGCESHETRHWCTGATPASMSCATSVRHESTIRVELKY